MRRQESCSKCTAFCAVPAGVQGQERALSCGCCFHSQMDYTDVEAGLAPAKQ